MKHLLNRILKWFTKETPEANYTETQVWDIVDGPYSRDDFPEEELASEGISDDDNWMLVAKVLEDGKIGLINLWFTDLEEARHMKDYFYSNITPLTLEPSEYYKKQEA